MVTKHLYCKCANNSLTRGARKDILKEVVLRGKLCYVEECATWKVVLRKRLHYVGGIVLGGRLHYLGGYAMWEVVLRGWLCYVGGFATWKVVLRGRLCYVGFYATWEVTLRGRLCYVNGCATCELVLHGRLRVDEHVKSVLYQSC